MSWKSVAASAAKQPKKGPFIRLKDGESVVFTLLGVPAMRETVFLDGKTETYDPQNPRHDRPRKRFLMNVLDRDAGGVKLLELSATVMNDALKLWEKRPETEWYFELERDGEGMDTRYRMLPDRQLTAQEHEHVAGLELHDLTEYDAVPLDAGKKDEPEDDFPADFFGGGQSPEVPS